MSPQQRAAHGGPARRSPRPSPFFSVALLPADIWGTWNGIIERSAEAIRRVGLMLRFFGRRDFFISAEWIPFTPEATQMETTTSKQDQKNDHGVFASAFPRGEETVYAFINFNGNAVGTAATGVQLVPSAARKAAHYYDCYNGVPLVPDPKTGGLSFTIRANGFGCVLATPNATVADLDAGARAMRAMRAGETGGAPSIPKTLAAFLGMMAVMTKKPLAEYDDAFHYNVCCAPSFGAQRFRRVLRARPALRRLTHPPFPPPPLPTPCSPRSWWMQICRRQFAR